MVYSRLGVFSSLIRYCKVAKYEVTYTFTVTYIFPSVFSHLGTLYRLILKHFVLDNPNRG